MSEEIQGRLAGKAVIVTGAASGIGRASSLLFAREGANVLAVDRNADGLSETARLAASAGTAIHIEAADTSKDDQVAGFVGRAIERFGALDVMFANAGISGGIVPLFEQSVDYWNEVLQVNLIGTFLAVKYAGRHMVERGRGSIVLTASVAGLRANAAAAPYSASKAGVISLAQTAAVTLQGTGVRINAICPGLIETGMTRALFDMARLRGTSSRIGQLNSLQRAGAPDEIAAMALFLASDEASYVTGQAFAVDGGLSATHPFAHPIR
jgi:NAD(P)-dependent dehydrogenase (short-subunit alcohol dehydrogenase family)